MNISILMDFSPLLLVSPLTFWNWPTIETVPANAAEGSDVLLRGHNLPKKLYNIRWSKREEKVTSHQIAEYVTATQKSKCGPVYSG
jgi:hypothetical protein